ncbi:hypothetical protein RHGRI_020478 [Rhododendron griersonianum]|uniref:PUM-HD domain-containing protein n=1 Tax=Rhododendron griersonianum TaxID=479676 RepID=A0AAV6JNV9_9ERIC|nr:hypothetical protein RHGRI_020478 [Rhododendron griersonianum]
MVAMLDGNVMRCVRDQNGNHVIQKCIKCIPVEAIQFIISVFYDQVVSLVTLSTHPYVCHVIQWGSFMRQRILEYCSDPKTQRIVMHEVLQSVCMLTQDQYGNYAVQTPTFCSPLTNRICYATCALLCSTVHKTRAYKKGSSFSRLRTLENTEMDDMLDSECSSGCESGWTLYLENSFLSPYPLKRRKTEKQSVSEDEEEEDLSMLLDASSGPRIFHEECFSNAGCGFFCHAALDAALPKNRGKREKNRGNRHREVEEDDPSFLDDTASSPIVNFSHVYLHPYHES